MNETLKSVLEQIPLKHSKIVVRWYKSNGDSYIDAYETIYDALRKTDGDWVESIVTNVEELNDNLYVIDVDLNPKCYFYL